jgi:hypothetical protein
MVVENVVDTRKRGRYAEFKLTPEKLGHMLREQA